MPSTSIQSEQRADPAPPADITISEAFLVWLRIALLSFGGPAGQIALMHRVLVEERKWISDARFLHALNFCMLLPGPEAQQLAIYIGWLLHGVRGGVMAGTLFVLPGFIVIVGLSTIYALYGALDLVSGLFFGLKAAVLAIVIEALLRIARRALKTRALYTLAAIAFIAIFGLWELAADMGWIDPFFYASPSAVIERLVDWAQNGTTEGSLWFNLWVTMEEALAARKARQAGLERLREALA